MGNALWPEPRDVRLMAALILAYLEMRSGRNLRLQCSSLHSILAYWEMRSGRNYQAELMQAQAILAYWEMRSGRNG